MISAAYENNNPMVWFGHKIILYLACGISSSLYNDAFRHENYIKNML